MTKKRLVLIGMVILALLAFAASAFAQRSDTDGDGVLNASDKCPTVPGPASNSGCPLDAPQDTPDQDGDGVPDYVDSCPAEVGTGYSNGCPPEAPADTAPAAQPTNPPVLMFWESTTECMVGVPPTARANVNVREQPTTTSSVIGQLVPGQQFAPFFRDYDENNAVWFGGAPAGETWGWVAGGVVVSNGQCANLPMIAHIDAAGGLQALILTGTFDPPVDNATAEPSAEDWDLLTRVGSRVLIISGGGSAGGESPMERRICRSCDFRFVHRLDKSSPVLDGGGGNPPATAPPPTSAPAPAKPLPVLLVIADMSDAECAAVSGDYCVIMMLRLPEFGDAPGQCPPAGESARRLSKLLEAAIKGKVFKKVEIHGTARSGEPSPGLTVALDGDGSVMPVGLDEGENAWDYGCSVVGFVPNGESEVMGDGSVLIGVETFAVLLPAVQAG